MTPITENTQDTSRDCADIVRTGKLLLNGNLLTWDVTGCMEKDFHSCRDAFLHELRHAFPHYGMDDSTMAEMFRCTCKAPCANYMLIRVVTKLRELLQVQEEAFLTLPTVNEDGVLVEYFVNVNPACKRLCVGLRWPWTENIVEITPCGSRTIRGTLTSIQTEFDCPPPRGYKPQYRLCLNLNRSRWGLKKTCVCTIDVSEPLGESDSLDPAMHNDSETLNSQKNDCMPHDCALDKSQQVNMFQRLALKCQMSRMRQCFQSYK